MQKQILFLDRNENNYGPAPKCYEVLKSADLTKMSWYTRAFTKGTKSILSIRLADDFGLSEDRVVLGYGAEDLLKQAIQCYLKKGDKLMVPAYSWWYYKKMADEVGGVNVEYSLKKGTDSFYYDLDNMMDLYKTEKPNMIFISSPNNPTGNSIDKNDLVKFLDFVRDTIVVLDEAYFYNGITENVSEFINSYPNLLMIRTFSKYYALAGTRIGFAVLGTNHKPLVNYTNRYLGYNRLSELIAIAALDSPEYYFDIARKMKEDRQLYYSRLGKIPGFTVFQSNANFILVEIPPSIKNELNKFLIEKGIHLKFMDEELLNSHIRISLGTQEQNLRVVEAVEEFFK